MDIVDQIRADRENGAICLEREYKSRLMAVAVKLCRDRTEAEALVYQAFAEAVRRIETLTAYAPGATAYRWLCDGKPVEGGEAGTLTVAWTRGGVEQAPGFKVHAYQAVAVFGDFSGVTRESAPSAAADVKCRQRGTTFIIK